MAEAPVEYIKIITRQYAKLGYKPYGWIYNTLSVHQYLPGNMHDWRYCGNPG